MKSLLKASFVLVAAFAFANAALAYVSPGKLTGYVSDFANILSPGDRAAIDAEIGAFEATTSAEIAVVTVPSLGGDTVDNYAVKLFEDWGIGKKGKDNGALILVAPNERAARIEVGYGLEPFVTDAASSAIIRNTMSPAFRRGDYAAGIRGAVEGIIGLVEGNPEAVQYVGGGSSQPSSSIGYLIFFFFIFGLNLLGVMARTKSWWLGGVIGLVVGFILLGIVGALVCAAIGLAVDFVLSRYGSNWFNGPRGPRGPWFIGGFGGPRGGGGFGGFGGGRSGGGGASGSW